MEAIRLQQVIQEDGVLHISNVPLRRGQQVEVVLLFRSEPAKVKRTRMTARQLLDSGLIGLWQDRTDITDSSVYARQLREQAQQRAEIDDDHSR